MAMIQCEECGNWISDRAYSCPHCGCPMYEAPNYYDAGYQQEQGAMQAREEATESQHQKNKAIMRQNRIGCLIWCIIAFFGMFFFGKSVFSIEHLYSFGLFAICFIILFFLAGRTILKTLVWHVLIANLWIYEFIVMSACAGYLFGCISAMRSWE